MPLLNPWLGAPASDPQPGVLTPYIKSKEVWHCPADVGFDELDNYPYPNNLVARPSFYQAYGTSYLERTEIAFGTKTHLPRSYSRLAAYNNTPPCVEHGLAEVNILQDGNGSWHGSALLNEKRYDMLMADGHVANFTRQRFDDTWGYRLDAPTWCSQ